jgi:hypothetical protein
MKTRATAVRRETGARPRLDLPFDRFEIAINALTILGLLVELGLAIWGFASLPDRIPIHFDAAGEANGWGGPGWLLAMPAISATTVVPLLFLQRFPHVYNYPWAITPQNAPRQYRLARRLLAGVALASMLVMSLVLLTILDAARAPEAVGSNRGWLFPLVLLLPLVPLAIYFPAARRAR